jgi:hypothetical protein
MHFGILNIVMRSLALAGEICPKEPQIKPVGNIQIHPIEHS